MLGVHADWSQGGLTAGLRVERQQGLLLATSVVGQAPQPVPSTTMVSAQAGFDIAPGLNLSLGVNNLGNLNLAEKSPLFSYAETPRTWRLTLRGRW
jgi:outer membrane receptor for ferrienterochelin and colicins